MACDAGDRHAWRNSNKDQKRRHQEAATDAEHARHEADCQPHRQEEEDIYRQVCDWQIKLQWIIPLACAI